MPPTFCSAPQAIEFFLVYCSAFHHKFSIHKSVVQPSRVLLRTRLDNYPAASKWIALNNAKLHHQTCSLTYLACSLYSALPGSNAFPERVFSLMKNAKWRKDRNYIRMCNEVRTANIMNSTSEVFTTSFSLTSRLLEAAATDSKKCKICKANSLE